MEQLEMFGYQKNESEIVKIQNGEYIYVPTFFDQAISHFYLIALRQQIKWKQEKMNMYGKTLLFPRLTAWYGDSDKPYTFSGITLKPNTWTPELLDIESAIYPNLTFTI